MLQLMKDLEITIKITLKVDDERDILSVKRRVLAELRSLAVTKGNFSVSSVDVYDISTDVAELIPPVDAKYINCNPSLRNDILAIDKDYAIMTKETLAKLPDYTNSEPTLEYNGKMWKAKTRTGEWMLCWCNNADGVYIDINYRQVLIMD